MSDHTGNATVDDAPSSSTSLSLLDRARQRDDLAWQRLVDLYGPLIYRWCRGWGLSPNDAADIGQQVCLSLFQSLPQFQHRRVRGAFRAWLKTITRNKAIDHWRSRVDAPVDLPEGLADPAAVLNREENTPSDEATLLYQRAAELIRVDFSETTWRAFWMAVVEERPVADIAVELGITPNAVYIAKSRVLTRLRSEFADLLE